jgi:BirA family transcriptional regulator, biotin operon repressor / biotin---[acetyl-CoA-carboxylase] ligase
MISTSNTGKRLLELLRTHQGQYLSGAALATELGMTRTAIWKHIHALKGRGYPVTSHPKKGYQLLDIPDLLTEEELLSGLETRWLGKTYHYLPQVGSTNDYALQLASQGAPHGAVVVADQQSAGRGRLGRPWVSLPHCGLYVSLLLRDDLPSRDAPQATLIAGLTLVEVLQVIQGLPARIKWPNDVLIHDKKVAGILTEMQADQDVVRFLVIGIGINVNHRADQFDTHFRYPATSIAIERRETVRRSDLLLAFLKQFEVNYTRFRQDGLQRFLADLERTSAILGRTVTIHCGSQQLTGVALGLTTEGALRLGLPDSQERIIWVGDITRVADGF